VKRDLLITNLLALAIGVTPAGCTAAGPSDPVGDNQRSQIRESILRDDWARIARANPNAHPPAVPFMHTVTDYDRPAILVECLRRKGVNSAWLEDGIRFNPYVGPLEFERLSFGCSARYPSESEVVPYLLSSQRAQLFRYRRDMVRTCLLSVGVRSPAPPSGSAQPTNGTRLSSWNPYQDVWKRGLNPGPLSYLEQRCPPIPPWLDLSG
jgi:hypothetical protein